MEGGLWARKRDPLGEDSREGSVRIRKAVWAGLGIREPTARGGERWGTWPFGLCSPRPPPSVLSHRARGECALQG